MAAEIYAAIDVGSYEIAMKVFEMSAKKGVRELDHVRYRIDLGSESYASGRLGTAHIAEICRVLRSFEQVMKTWGVTRFRACGTSALRESGNVGIVIEQIEKRTGIRVEILSNSEQRFLDYKAIALRSEEFERIIEKPAAIVDIGGGSVQLSLFDNDRLIVTQNMRIGVLRLRERLDTLGTGAKKYASLVGELVGAQLSVFSRMYLRDKEIRNIIIIDDYISPILQRTEILKDAGLCADEESAARGFVSAERFSGFLDRVPADSQVRIAERLGVPYENIPLVYISGLIVRNVAEAMHAAMLWAPGVTLCDGIAYENAEKKKVLRLHHDFEGDIIASAYHISSRYKGNRKRSELIMELAQGIFDSMKKIHGLGRRERLLLQIAAILHDCGKYVSMMNWGDTSYAIIMSTEIIGLSHLERVIVAGAVRCIYLPSPENAVFEQSLLPVDDATRVVILKLAAILRVASGLDRSHLKKFRKSVFAVRDDELIITVDTAEDITLEKGLFGRRAAFFEDIFGIRPVIRRKGAR